MGKHPAAKDLIAFLEGKLERQQARTVIAHFLRGCPDCREAVAKGPVRGRDLPSRAYDAAFERVFATVQKQQVYRGASRMTSVPSRQSATPSRSQRSGRAPSTSTSHASAPAT